MTLSLHQRIGVDLGRDMPVEAGIAWAAGNDVHFLDMQTDLPPNALHEMPARAPSIRAKLAETGVRLGLHTLSGVNIAEISPHMAEAADAYLRSYIELAEALDAGWVIVHAGYHFTADHAARRQAGLERLKRASDHADRHGVRLLLENPNPEPRGAEVHYLAADLDEWLWYLERLDPAVVGTAFTANHAHLQPEGVAGFIAALDFARVGEVRLADCVGPIEEHLLPGEGTMDFAAMFAAIEGRGFGGHYMNQFATAPEMRDARHWLVAQAARAGVTGAAG